MAKIFTDSKGRYIQATKNGKKFYLRDTPEFKPKERDNEYVKRNVKKKPYG